MNTTTNTLVVERLQWTDDDGRPLHQVHVESSTGRPVTDVVIVANWTEYLDRTGLVALDGFTLTTNAWGNETLRVPVVECAR